VKYEIGEPIGLSDYSGEPILVGDVVMCFDKERPLSPWKYHFTSIHEKELRCENANNLYMWHPPIINLGPYWRLLAKENNDDVNGRRLLIDDSDLEYAWGTTRAEAVKRCIDELKGKP
jgi:hypothetical protein